MGGCSDDGDDEAAEKAAGPQSEGVRELVGGGNVGEM
jgi:hypothetical protein